MARKTALTILAAVILVPLIVFAATTVPTDIQQPGTQPGDLTTGIADPSCGCHDFKDPVAVYPNWQGSMMANAGRDPIFWATLAIAEQDFDGSGDLCIRCHSTSGWIEGRSTPTDGRSLLDPDDGEGVDCEFCHLMTNPDNSEHWGDQSGDFVANDSTTGDGYYGSGMTSILDGDSTRPRLGPYHGIDAGHPVLGSYFHRSAEYCGSCHDVSNPAVGDLAHNSGAQSTADTVDRNGIPDDPDGIRQPVDTKAAFRNFPYKYGVVERTFSEHMASVWPTTLVSAYSSLPAELQDGAIANAYNLAAVVSGTGGNYVDGAARYFTCQTCHVPAVTGKATNSAPTRSDMPLHDMTGGNYWMADAIQYLDALGKLRLGGGLKRGQNDNLDAAQLRAQDQLDMAAALKVNGNTLKVVNLTGHKLISGYPEGRRMWLNIKWYDTLTPAADEEPLREDGAYGPLWYDHDEDPGTPDVPVTETNPADGQLVQVESLLDLHDSNTKIYEAHYGMTKEWAGQLLSLGRLSDFALSYDRYTGAVNYTLGQLAAQEPDPDHETFHFVLNNTVVKDNRIPPYGMRYEEARKRNALPVPATQYGDPPSTGSYDHFDLVTLNPPSGAASAEISLMYQPTSWEYIQFLYKANNTPAGEFLADEGVNMLEAWLNTGMAAPYTMATATWTSGNSCDESAPLADSQWTLFSLACDVAGTTTVGDIAFDMAGAYDTGWAVYRRDESTDSYVHLAETDIVEPGEGYWIKNLGPDGHLDVTGGFNDDSPIDLVTDSSGRFNMVGYPHTFSLPWSSVRIYDKDGDTELTLEDVDPGGICQTDPSDTNCIMSRVGYTWNGNAYDVFDGTTPVLEGTLVAFDGLWVKAFRGNIALKFPLAKAATTKGAGTAHDAKAKKPAADDGSWFVRLMASSGEMLDSRNALGQLADSSDGPDVHDLVELEPFGNHFLTIVFPHHDWGERSGNYTSDFHAPTTKPKGTWEFTVRASSDVMEPVVLSWQGPAEVLGKARLTDLTTGERMRIKPGTSYTYEANGLSRSFRLVIGGGH